MPSVPAAMWYVMVGDIETGPLTRVDVGVEAASGGITGETLVWRQGMSDWVPGAKVPELAQLFLRPPKSPRGRPPPPKPKEQQKGMGVSDFDTAHFRLADLATQKELEGDSGLKRDLEFDTAHFRLADLGQAAPKATKGGDRVAVPKRILPKGPQAQGPLELDVPQPKAPAKARSAIKQASTAAVKSSEPPPAVKSVRAAAAPKPAAPAKPQPSRAAGAAPPPVAEEPFDPNRTSVDFRTLGALVNKQQAAQSLFEKEVVPDAPEVEPEQPQPDPHAAELSKWAAQQLKEDEKSHPDLAARLKAKALAKPPPPLPTDEVKAPSMWLYVGIAGGILAALAFVAFLLWD
ncbi:MAG: DUF4339 domain-containing protein [Myxococcales bacterium]|nr:DUF4339 domain-containing protein [Myxococcales bacterium]